MGLNLHELAIEYCDLLSDYEDEDLDMDEGDLERFRELKVLNDELNDGLYYPNLSGSWEVVREGDEDAYAMEWNSSMGHISEDNPAYNYIDWKDWGEDLITDFLYNVEWEGIKYNISGGS